jgi:serine/threonine protein kinase
MEYPPPPSTSLWNAYPQPGDVLDGKYRIEKMLGEGGMGAVAKATHLVRRAPVALKFMSGAVLSLPGAVERFVNEGVAASQIDSDHVVKVFDVGRLPSGAPYLVMEFLDGRDLSDVILQEGPRIEPARAVHFGLQMLRALHTAHGAGIVHRDMKPSNCFVIEKDGEPDFLKLVDFGISKVRYADEDQGPNLTRTNSALGTPLYMSPEQARSPRDVDRRSDLYSVGAILYEMLCGRTPYTAESGEYTEILFKIFTTDPEPVRDVHPDVPDGLASAVHRALTRERDGRFATALDMGEALAPFAGPRSAEVIGKMRAMRGRSMVPRPMRLASRAAQPSAASESDPFPAPTFPAAGTPGADALRAPRVPTDVGLTRSAGSGAHSTRRQAIVGVSLAIAAVILLVAMGMFVQRARSPSPEPASAPPRVATGTLVDAQASAAASAKVTPPVASSLPTAPSAVVLIPRPPTVATTATAPSGSAVPSESPKPTARAPGIAPPPPLPTQLGDLKLH